MKISTAARDAACNAIVDLIDVSGPGHLYIRTGAPPSTPATADSGTLLATLTMSNPAFGNSSTGTATASAITADTNAAATNTAAHFRIKDGAGVVILQGTVTATGMGGDLTLNSTSIVAGGTVAVTSLTFTIPIGS